MAGEKTEQPTDKKLRDAAKKGQTFKMRDLIVALMLLAAVSYLVWAFSFSAIADLYRGVIAQRFETPMQSYLVELGLTFFKLVLPFIVLCTVVSALPSLLMSRFALASEALNPVEGFKKLFSLRTVKELVKALLYLTMALVAVAVFWNNNKNLIFALLHGRVQEMNAALPQLFIALIATSLACGLPIYLLDALAEYYLHIKNLKMDKHEVKQEHKEQDGNPEIKQQRRQLHMDLINEQIKSDVAQSNFILANPTHIAIGVFFNVELSPAPFISVLETNQRALAVIAYAEKCGVPVVRDIPLARSLYKTVSRYSFIPMEQVDGIYRILEWLYQVENNAIQEFDPPVSESDTRPATDTNH